VSAPEYQKTLAKFKRLKRDQMRHRAHSAAMLRSPSGRVRN
jgi:hypothetical protein